MMLVDRGDVQAPDVIWGFIFDESKRAPQTIGRGVSFDSQKRNGAYLTTENSTGVILTRAYMRYVRAKTS